MAHTFFKEGAQTSWVQGAGHRTAFYPYVKGDDKHQRPLIESCHRPYGDIWLGGEIIRPSGAEAKSELVSKLIPHI